MTMSRPAPAGLGPPPTRHARGFTLVELLVALAVGLITTLAIAQSLIAAQGQQMRTTRGSDAQVNGALALYELQRAVQSAGYGLISQTEGLGCPIRARHADAAEAQDWLLTPVLITPGADGAPDRLRVMSSDNGRYAVPIKVAIDHPRTAANFFVDTTLGVAPGDLMVALPLPWDETHWCSVFNVTQTGGAGSGQLIHNPGSDGPWNQAGGQTIFPEDGYPAFAAGSPPRGTLLLNLGRLLLRDYAIDAGQALVLSELDSARGANAETGELFPHIVQLQALYAKDSDGDGAVDRYDDVQPTDAAGWAQVLGLRLAVVARSAQAEREAVTLDSPSWRLGRGVSVPGSSACGDDRCLPLRLDILPEGWQHYRYSVFETLVPLRNRIWHA